VFLVRQSKPEDASTLHKLARTVYFINLPPDERIIGEKISHSQRCFRSLVEKPSGKADAHKNGKPKRPSERLGGYVDGSDLFMFSILEPETGAVVGTSQVRARMGGPGDPNWRMRVYEKKFFSAGLGFGTTHTVAKLDGDESGPTEVGGLILDPGFRGHRMRPGRFISFVRFHLMGLFRERFAQTVIAEMMGSVTSAGESAFWDAFGRKFIPVTYAEADRFCQHNRAFISELLPKEEIFLTLFPLEIQNIIGVVPKETLPARKLLESIGFRYRHIIDPFDGGPHLDAPAGDIALIRDTKRAVAARASGPCTKAAIVSFINAEGEFRAVETWVDATKDGTVRLEPQVFEALAIEPGAQVGCTLMGKFGLPRDDGRADVAVPAPRAKRVAARSGGKATSRRSPRPPRNGSKRPKR